MNNIVVLLRRTALKTVLAVLDHVNRAVRAEGGVLVNVAEHLGTTVSGLSERPKVSIDLRQPFWGL